MAEEQEEYTEENTVEEVDDEIQRKPWHHHRRNWGFWVLIIGFIAFLITWFIVKPLLESGNPLP